MVSRPNVHSMNYRDVSGPDNESAATKLLVAGYLELEGSRCSHSLEGCLRGKFKKYQGCEIGSVSREERVKMMAELEDV